MRIYFIFLLSILSFMGCKENTDRKFKEIEKNGITAKGYVINDTLFDDTVYYYNKDNVVIRKEFFKIGKKYGLSIDYHSNGVPKIQTMYPDGLKNGFNSYFDTAGNCFYRDYYYYYDLVTGPIEFYYENRMPKRFFFVNLQNETLMDIDYNYWAGIKNIVPNCINYTYNIQKEDTIRKASLLLYLINPPRFSFMYSLLELKRKSDEEVSVVHEFENSMPFENLSLPLLPDSLYYSIRLAVYDSLLRKKTIINKEVW